MVIIINHLEKKDSIIWCWETVGSEKVSKAINDNRKIDQPPRVTKLETLQTKSRAFMWLHSYLSLGMEGHMTCTSYFLL